MILFVRNKYIGSPMKTTTYKNYTVARLESGTIEATKDGHIASPTKPLLREIAQELGIINGDLHNTRQLGALVIRAIEKKQISQNLQLEEEIDIGIAKPIENKFHDNEDEKTIPHISFIGKIKQTLNRLKTSSIANIENLVEDYLYRDEHGIFYLEKGARIESVLIKNAVPNKYGVYIIYSVKDNQEEIIYIGKAGTITTNGKFKRQGIRNRLKAVATNNMPRSKYFQQEVIEKYGFDKLKFVWIVTFNDTRKELPAHAEAKLVQLYYDNYHKLPILNIGI